MANDVPLLAVVDDGAEVRVALTRLVSSAGFGFETFASGADFLRSIEDHEPNCVVLDLHIHGQARQYPHHPHQRQQRCQPTYGANGVHYVAMPTPRSRPQAARPQSVNPAKAEFAIK